MTPDPRDLARQARLRREGETGIRLTKHALERMAEMGATAGDVEEILDNPSTTRPSRSYGGGRMSAGTLAVSDSHPDWAVIYKVEDELKVVLTVVFRTDERYDRDGRGYTVR